MTDLTYLKGLLDLAKSSGVTHIKMAGLEMVLGPSSQVDAQVPASPAIDPLEGLKKLEESLPPEFRADDLMNADKVLFFSAPDQGQDTQMPLTEELTL